jgi:hypothetical protein
MERLIEEGQISIAFARCGAPLVTGGISACGELTSSCGQKQTWLTATMESLPVGYMRLEDQFSASTVWINDEW